MTESWNPDFLGPRHELRERLLLRLLLSAEPGPQILDLGAGAGTFSARLAARGFSVTSADAAPEAVERLRRLGAGEVFLADASDLPFPPASFDAVVLAEVLEHVEDDLAALREVGRVLRPGGVLLASVPSSPERLRTSDRLVGHRRRYDKRALLDVCASAGLQVVRCQGWGFPVSTLYHRYVYEPYVGRRGPTEPAGWARLAVPLLRGLLQLDRLFVGVERGALGYLLLARNP